MVLGQHARLERCRGGRHPPPERPGSAEEHRQGNHDGHRSAETHPRGSLPHTCRPRRPLSNSKRDQANPARPRPASATPDHSSGSEPRGAAPGPVTSRTGFGPSLTVLVTIVPDEGSVSLGGVLDGGVVACDVLEGDVVGVVDVDVDVGEVAGGAVAVGGLVGEVTGDVTGFTTSVVFPLDASKPVPEAGV
jgi:hypothetical protein